jgi:hypothetical protein
LIYNHLKIESLGSPARLRLKMESLCWKKRKYNEKLSNCTVNGTGSSSTYTHSCSIFWEIKFSYKDKKEQFIFDEFLGQWCLNIQHSFGIDIK